MHSTDLIHLLHTLVAFIGGGGNLSAILQAYFNKGICLTAPQSFSRCTRLFHRSLAGGACWQRNSDTRST
jgi:hypothetical protein